MRWYIPPDDWREIHDYVAFEGKFGLKHGISYQEFNRFLYFASLNSDLDGNDIFEKCSVYTRGYRWVKIRYKSKDKKNTQNHITRFTGWYLLLKTFFHLL